MQPNLHRFDRLMLGVALDAGTDTLDDVISVAGSRWEVFPVQNIRGQGCLREVATYREMLPHIGDGVNDVTFCLHAKGVQDHTSTSDCVKWWTEAMYETVYDNIDGVLQPMKNNALVVGSFRRRGRHFATEYGWHFSGTFYAFRNHAAFYNRFPAYKNVWWGTESWPGQYFHITQSHCIFGDYAGDLYTLNNQPRKQLEKWRIEHGTAAT
jgi:hypothetical protein